MLAGFDHPARIGLRGCHALGRLQRRTLGRLHQQLPPEVVVDETRIRAREPLRRGVHRNAVRVQGIARRSIDRAEETREDAAMRVLP